MVALGGMGVNIGLGMGFPYSFQHANYNAACQQVKVNQYYTSLRSNVNDDNNAYVLT